MSGDAGALTGALGRGAGPRASRKEPAPRQFSSAAWRSILAQTAGVVLLTGAALRAALTPPYSWWREFVVQGADVVRRITVPLCLSIFAFGFGVIGVQAGLVLSALGSPDRNGGLAVTGTVREVAAWLTAMVVGGVGGTAICADLGARKTRDELDALAVIGVDAVRTLVTPRILAMVVFTPMLFLFAVLSCVVSAMLGTAVLHGASFGSFQATMAANFTVVELLAGLVKTTFFGLTIGAVASYKGLTATGGPEGVGRAVNQAVVITFVVLWVFNYAFTSVLLANFPELLGLR